MRHPGIRQSVLVFLACATVVGIFFMMYPFHRHAPSSLLLRIGAVVGVVLAAAVSYIWFIYGQFRLSSALFLLGAIATGLAVENLETSGAEVLLYVAFACWAGALGVRHLWEQKRHSPRGGGLS